MGYLLRCVAMLFYESAKNSYASQYNYTHMYMYMRARARAQPLHGFYLVVTRERRVENRRTGTDSHVSCDSNIGRRMRYETQAFFSINLLFVV